MGEQLISQLAFVGVGLFLYANLIFAISIVKKRNDIADVAWGMAYCIIILLLLINGASLHPISFIVFLLVFIWGIRLSAHIYVRNRDKAEDFRYKKWREEWGETFYWRSYLQVYMLQAFFAFIISIPIILTGSVQNSGIHLVSTLGILIWIIGFYFQVAGDYQLSKFKKESSGEDIIKTGLWKYSRHPNYFGEVAMWWGIFIICLPLEYGIVTIVSPIVITYLIRYVSGVPMLEKRYDNNGAYQEYKKQVPALLPKFW